MLIPTILHIVLRLLFRPSSLPPSKGSLTIYIITFLPIFFLSRYLEKIGTTKRDASGTLVSSGEDLNQAGITEWCFDVIYVTCMSFQPLRSFASTLTDTLGACQVASGAFGEKVWYFWLVVTNSLTSIYGIRLMLV